MKVTWNDVQWLREHQPRLAAGVDVPQVVGALEVSAYYDREVRRIATGRRFGVGDHDTFIADHFVIDIRLNAKDRNGWPKVYDVGKRHQSIARRYRLPVADLHFYADGHACLGLTYPWDPPFTLEHFVAELVEPFFYRLAYVDLYGLPATRAGLWPELSHGEAGLREHRLDVRRGLSGPTAAHLSRGTFQLSREHNLWPD